MNARASRAEIWIDDTKVADNTGYTIMTQALWTSLGGPGTITPGANSPQFGATANSDTTAPSVVLIDNIVYTVF